MTDQLPLPYSDYTVRLPFESEWEWAARGALVGADYPTGRPSAEDRFLTEGTQGPSPVGGSAANGYGLRDMSGNVWEWCMDWYDSNYYKKSPTENPKGPSTGHYRVLRGRSWYGSDKYIRSADRYRYNPDTRNAYDGFRIVVAP